MSGYGEKWCENEARRRADYVRHCRRTSRVLTAAYCLTVFAVGWAVFQVVVWFRAGGWFFFWLNVTAVPVNIFAAALLRKLSRKKWREASYYECRLDESPRDLRGPDDDWSKRLPG